MLDRGGDKMITAAFKRIVEQAKNGHVIALSGAAGKENVGAVEPEDPCDRFPGVRDDRFCVCAENMGPAVGVSIMLLVDVDHLRKDTRINGSRGIIVKIYGHQVSSFGNADWSRSERFFMTSRTL